MQNTFSFEQEQPAPSTSWRWIAWAALVFLLAALAYWLGASRTAPPAEASAEVGFSRDMMTHHAQAVDMATLIRDRSHDPEIRQVALDILLTQQAQIGQMQGWLVLWGYPLARTGPAMEWMSMPTNGRMPGLASPEQLNELRSLEEEAADVLFLQLMIPHHESGVEMARAALAQARLPEVQNLARAMLEAQEIEIDLMRWMLDARGAPAPGPEAHGGH